MKQTVILFLAANPVGTCFLRIAEEIKKIKQGIRSAEYRDRISFQQEHAVTVPDMRRAMQLYRPDIVHFSGHGSGETGLCFENDEGKTQYVEGKALADFFKLFADQVSCVVLNACYSETQAEAIAQYIDFVIGMSDLIFDETAIAFSKAFYGNNSFFRGIFKEF